MNSTPSKNKALKPIKARLPSGFEDHMGSNVKAMGAMLEAIYSVYERYGFDVLETPFFEYTDALGKFLPDSERPNEGVFSLLDDDQEWLSLRYDLTAPLARFVAQNFEHIPKPFRSYRSGYVFRNEKPGPGRFRQFMQCDADTVGAPVGVADAEICMMMADVFEHIGFADGEYVIRINNRKILDGLLETLGLSAHGETQQKLVVLRAIDKLDRLGVEGVSALLTTGRMDDSGDFTKGAGLCHDAAQRIVEFVTAGADTDNPKTLSRIQTLVAASTIGCEGVEELSQMDALFSVSGYASDRICIDPSVVRGLEYYTGPVFEAELTFETFTQGNNPDRFGSVGGGGRYDGLVGRFRCEHVPATGISIGVSRLLAALSARKKTKQTPALGPVVVLVMDRDQIAGYQAMVTDLRKSGVRAELYLGSSGMKAQMKYADRRRAPCVIIQGSDERARNEVQIKDLIKGRQLAASIDDNKTWRQSRPAQFTAPVSDLVHAVKKLLANQSDDAGTKK